MDEGRKSLGIVQGVNSKGEIRNIRTDDNGNILIGIDNKISKILYSKYLEINETQTINISGEIKEIDIANYSETEAITINNIEVGPNIALTLSGKDCVSPLVINGTSKIYICVKGVETDD